MASKNNKSQTGKKQGSFAGKLAGLIALALFTIFFCGHLSAVIDAGAGVGTWPEMILEHIKTAPMDFLHINGYVAYFAVCIYTLIFFMAFSKRELPKAEMKGAEHGSNDFQTEEERIQFLTANTSPVFSLNLREFWE